MLRGSAYIEVGNNGESYKGVHMISCIVAFLEKGPEPG